MWYSWGEDDQFAAGASPTRLSGLIGAGGQLNHAVNVGEVAVAIDQVDDHVHIAYVDTTNNQIWHAECTAPTNPVNANWTVFGAVPQQRCDNTANVKSGVSIAVDSATNAGTKSPHVIWEEAGTSIRYNGSIAAGHAMGAPLTLANTPGEAYPTIIVAEDEGREIYAFWVDNAGTSIECMKVIDPANPQVLANWGGPAAGAGGGVDIALAPAVGDTAISAPSATWWWDADERVIVGAVLTGAIAGTDRMVTNYWDETAGPAAWAGKAVASAAGFIPAGCMLVNRSNANNWTAYVFDNAAGLEFAQRDGSYSFAGRTWYTQATTGPNAGSYMSAEWRHLEVISADHSVCVWVDNANNLWYGETRINVAPTVAAIHPTGGEYENELGVITFIWDVTDTDGDIQREYYVEIDDDVAFGSPVADPGSNLRLNTWTLGAAETGDLNADVLTAATTYYWRTKVRDDEYGTEYDPNSEGSFGAATTLKTTPQLAINITGATVTNNKSVSIEFTLSRAAGVGWTDVCELTAWEVDSGGGYGAMTQDAVYHNPIVQVPGDMDLGISDNFSFGWDAHTDLAADFDSTVDMRLTVRYDTVDNDHSLGTVNNVEAGFAIDFKAPINTDILAPAGGTTTIPKPTFTVSATDTNTWQFKIGVYRDAAHLQLFDSSANTTPASNPAYLPVGTTTWKMNENLDKATTWYVIAKTRDSTPPQNEGGWQSESFIFDPPPDPIECQDGTYTLEIDPTKLWTGSEFDVVIMGDDIDSVKLEENFNAPNRLNFTLNNYDGRYVDPTSSFVMQKGDEVKLVKGDSSFYGVVTNLKPLTHRHRELKVYCESFSGAAEREPIQLRILPTEESGLYFEDYIRIGAHASGLAPKWFLITDASGNEIFPESASNKTPVLSGNPIILNKVSFVELLNEYSSRTGKVWWESGTPPTSRKATIYLADAADTSEGTADHTLHVEKDILEQAMNFDFDSLINRVIYTDADVVEQDMDSIREHGVFLHKMRAGSSSTVDEERLIEIAQYILNDRSSPRAFGKLPLAGEYDISPNDLVQVYEDGADDTKSGFEGLYLVAGVDLVIGNETKTILSLSSRWEDPLIQDLLEMMKEATSSGSDAMLTILRPETAEARLETPATGVDLSTEATYVAGRLGIDRYSDEGTDAAYYSVYGID